MTKKQTLLTIALIAILVATIAIPSIGTTAQDATDEPNPTQDYGWNGCWAVGGNGHGQSMWQAIADELGMDMNALYGELQSGRPLAEIARQHGVDMEQIYQAAEEAMTENMNDMVEMGYMTREQADYMLSQMNHDFGAMSMHGGEGFGYGCMGGGMMHGNMMGGGMMGSGMMGGNMMGGGMMGGGMMGSGMMGQQHRGWGQ